MILTDLDVIVDEEQHVKHGFILAFYFLLRLESGCNFEQAIRYTIQQGGDTDTNACIVGGLLGAAVGLDGIPAHMRLKVLELDCAADDLMSKKRQRPAFLSIKRNFGETVKALLANRPKPQSKMAEKRATKANRLSEAGS